MIRVVCLLIGYMFGLIQTSYILGRIKGIDIREYGSGNAGTTNTLRVLGKKAGLIVFLVDLFKTIIPVALTGIIIANTSLNDKYGDMIYLLKLYTGLGAVLGHNFPFYLKFKGGKGIAASGGMILGYHWIFVPIDFVIFFGTFALTHYVSLASILLLFGFFVQMVIMAVFGWSFFAGVTTAVTVEICILTFIISFMAIFRHRANIKRLLDGCERKTYLGKKKSEQ